MKELAQRVASYVHLCTLYWWLRFITCQLTLLVLICSFLDYEAYNHVQFFFYLFIVILFCCRPFGCGVILGGYDRDGPQLYMVEPSGVSYVS